MKHRWVVVANRTEARIYRERPFQRIGTLENEIGREKNRAFTTDKPGSGRSGFSQSLNVHAMTGEKSPHDDAAIQFARRLCRFLESQGQSRRYDELVIAAEPKMLGRIRAALAKNLLNKIDWLTKDFGHLSDYRVGKALGLTPPRATSL